MTNTDEIKSTIVKSLETANKDEIADAYECLVSCGNCPYWHDCRNERDHCYDYILDKLEADDEEEKEEEE